MNSDWNLYKDRVKITHFLEQGFNINGIIHVGANDGYEVEWYLKMGIKNILAFEPLLSAIEIFKDTFSKYENVMLIEYGLGERNEERELLISKGDGKSSSFLHQEKEIFVETEFANIRRFDELVDEWKIDMSKYNYLVIDAEGMELPALKGMGKYLQKFEMMHVECSRTPYYVGDVPAQTVIEFIESQGFQQDSPIEDHDDIFFIRKGLK